MNQPRPRYPASRSKRAVPEHPAEIVPPDGEATITRLRAIGSEGQTIAVVVGRKTVAKLRASDADALGLAKGQLWTLRLADAVAIHARTHAARTHALRLVAARSRTASDLVRRLTRAGHAERDAREAAEALCSAGIINDVRFAEAAAATLADRRGMSRRGIELKLRAKGVPADTARRAASEARDAEDDTASARELAAKRLSRMTSIEDEAVAKRRLLGFLLRRGFDHDDAFAAVDAALRDRREALD